MAKPRKTNSECECGLKKGEPSFTGQLQTSTAATEITVYVPHNTRIEMTNYPAIQNGHVPQYYTTYYRDTSSCAYIDALYIIGKIKSLCVHQLMNCYLRFDTYPRLKFCIVVY